MTSVRRRVLTGRAARGTRFTLSRDEPVDSARVRAALALPQRLLPEGQMSSYDGDVYPVDVGVPPRSSRSSGRALRAP